MPAAERPKAKSRGRTRRVRVWVMIVSRRLKSWVEVDGRRPLAPVARREGDGGGRGEPRARIDRADSGAGSPVESEQERAVAQEAPLRGSRAHARRARGRDALYGMRG